MERCGRHPECDPKVFPDAVQIAELNYLDTIELAYSGAQIIHPKTIKPLQNKNIPLYVRPFRGQAKTGHGDSPYVGADRGSDSDSEEGSGIADDPFAGLFLRARREIRGDLLPAGAIPYQGQSGA